MALLAVPLAMQPAAIAHQAADPQPPVLPELEKKPEEANPSLPTGSGNGNNKAGQRAPALTAAPRAPLPRLLPQKTPSRGQVPPPAGGGGGGGGGGGSGGGGSGGGGSGGGGSGGGAPPSNSPPEANPDEGSNPEPPNKRPPIVPDNPEPRETSETNGPRTLPFVRGALWSSNATIINVDSADWLVTQWHALLPGDSETNVDVELIAIANGDPLQPLSHFQLPVSAFRHIPGASSLVAANITAQQELLSEFKTLKFAADSWTSAGVGTPLNSTVVEQADTPNQLVKTEVTKTAGDPSKGVGGWIQIPVVPTVADCAGGSFTTSNVGSSMPRLVGIGDAPNTNGGSPTLRVRKILGQAETEKVITDGIPLDPCQLFETMIPSWGNPTGLRALVELLRENEHDVLVGWKMARLGDRGYQDEYHPANLVIDGSRIIAVLSENPADSVDLFVRKPSTGGNGDDDESWTDAAVRIPHPERATGATRRVRTNKPSSARILILEVASTDSGPCVLRNP
jgi:hypothetical protein